MDPIRGFLRMARWGRRPASARRVRLVAAVVVICLILFAIERMFGWPPWLTPNRIRL